MRRRDGTRRVRWAAALIVVGASLAIGGFVYGSIVYGSLGNHLKAVPLGTQLTFRPSGSYLADIFIPQPASPTTRAPACSVTTTAGRAVTLTDANPYAVNEKLGMAANYGFDLSSGDTYLVTCGSRGDTGKFAVVEVPGLPRVLAAMLFVPGVAAVVAGLMLAVIARRRKRRAALSS